MADEAAIAAIGIRPARTGDAEAIVAYLTALTRERLDTILMREPPTLEDERDWLLRAKLSERTLVLLATRGEQIVGLLELAAGRTPQDRHAARFGMSVAKAWRGCGVGRKLLAAAIEEAKGWPGFCRVELECTPWNTAAITLYERLGFVVEGRRRRAVNLRGEPEDMLVMALVW